MKRFKKADINVFVTMDYDQFRKMGSNRDVNKSHLAKLKSSMGKKFLATIVVVNRSLEIIDGQHRFEACRDLGKPVLFIIKDYGIEDVKIYNSVNKVWCLERHHEHVL